VSFDLQVEPVSGGFLVGADQKTTNKVHDGGDDRIGFASLVA
jgi:hypothetical protein